MMLKDNTDYRAVSPKYSQIDYETLITFIGEFPSSC